MNYRECANLLKQHDVFLLLTHKNPDGDTVCSAAALCSALRRAGKTVGLATSKPQNLAEMLLERAGLLDCFDVIAGSDPKLNNNAKWEVITRAMDGCGAAPENTVLIGDTKYDVAGAKRCGIPCVGVRWGYAAEGEMEEAGVAAMVDTPEELLQLLCGEAACPAE